MFLMITVQRYKEYIYLARKLILFFLELVYFKYLIQMHIIVIYIRLLRI